MTDSISDMLSRIRNAGLALQPVVEVPHSRIKESIAQILRKEGYVSDVVVDGSVARKRIKLKLKYQGKQSVIEGLRRVSRPGIRHYVGATDIPRVLSGLGICVLSTPEGIMTGAEARKKNLGGEVLCYVW
jgi:small subunit ribosomal protein S8